MTQSPGPRERDLETLHQISRVLMRFERFEQIAPRVLTLAAERAPLRSAVLITVGRGPERPYVWRSADLDAGRVRTAVERALSRHAHFADPPSVTPPYPEPRFIALPLAGCRGEHLGTLQLEWARPPGDTDLAFAGALADQLALALDRAAREEAARQLYEQAQRATRSREDLLATVSHDLKNLLSVIRASLAMVLKAEPRESQVPERSRKPLLRIQRSSERMVRLIQDLLDMASVENERLSVEARRQEVGSLVAEALEGASPLAALKSILLQSDVPASIGAVHADAVRIQQVFTNLLSNAIKFSPEGGTITVRAEPAGPGEIRFSVCDDGPGIACEDLPHLFDRFWQARPTAGLGYGLGLFIVKGIVKAHGGKVWAESRLGAGSTFFFTVPSAPAESLRSEPERWR
ncbi:MAG TPA: HAMP domain-containing sensor histidine kinase [Myxococcales bacterium]|nr:HAMP domain-containing sensor histidine kinase [Myxococcales bacterium]